MKQVVHYHVQNSTPSVSTLRIHSMPSLPSSIRSIFILSSYLVLQMASSLQFPHQNPACISFCLHACHTHHPRIIDHPNIWGRVEIMKLYNFLQLLVPSYVLGPSMFLGTLFLNTLSLCHTLNVKD